MWHDLVGQKFGKLTVIERAGNDSQGHRTWLCQCECGNMTTVVGSNLIRGKPDHTISCGCASAAIDEVGNKYGALTVIKYAGGGKKKSAEWLCRCDCGNEVIIKGTALRNGDRAGCGHGCESIAKYKTTTLPNGQAAFNNLLRRYKGSAKRRDYSFELNKEQVKILFQSNCYYCGQPPSQIVSGTPRGGDFIYNGIDRLDNSKGYTIDNTVPCCGTCNRAKNSHDVDDFKNWICRVYENWAGK